MAQKGNHLSAESAFLPAGGICLQLWAEMVMYAKVKMREVKFKMASNEHFDLSPQGCLRAQLQPFLLPE